MSRIYKNKVDENHAQVRDELREVLHDGTIHDMSGAGNGFPDLCVGWRGLNFLIEVKRKQGGSRLTSRQATFHQNWQGQVAVCRTASEALAIMLREVYKK